MRVWTLDTDVLIAALDQSDAHHLAARSAMEPLLAEGASFVICTINYAEALVRPASSAEALELAVDAISVLGVEPQAPTAATARGAARHRGLGVSLADGFALATAQASSTAIASFDKRVLRAAEELGIPLAF